MSLCEALNKLSKEGKGREGTLWLTQTTGDKNMSGMTQISKSGNNKYNGAGQTRMRCPKTLFKRTLVSPCMLLVYFYELGRVCL